MTTYDRLILFSNASFVVGALCLLAAFVMFFRFRIKAYIDQWSGKTERDEMRRILSDMKKANTERTTSGFPTTSDDLMPEAMASRLDAENTLPKDIEAEIRELLEEDEAEENYTRPIELEQNALQKEEESITEDLEARKESTVSGLEDDQIEKREDETTVLEKNEPAREKSIFLGEEETTALGEEGTTVLDDDGTTVLETHPGVSENKYKIVRKIVLADLSQKEVEEKNA